MINDQQNSNLLNPNKKKYDLVDRTTRFSKQLINLCKKIPENSISKPLISQLIRSGTSIGANYSEADEAASKKDFLNKIFIAKKEAKETRYWLNLLDYSFPTFKEEMMILKQEAQEVNLIFAAIIVKSQTPMIKAQQNPKP